jgi:hypothetical protein
MLLQNLLTQKAIIKAMAHMFNHITEAHQIAISGTTIQAMAITIPTQEAKVIPNGGINTIKPERVLFLNIYYSTTYFDKLRQIKLILLFRFKFVKGV